MVINGESQTEFGVQVSRRTIFELKRLCRFRWHCIQSNEYAILSSRNLNTEYVSPLLLITFFRHEAALSN